MFQRVFTLNLFSCFLIYLLSSENSYSHQLGEKLYLDHFSGGSEIVLKADIDALLTFPLALANHSELKEIIGSSTGSSQDAFNWLQKWVHFIYTEPFVDSERCYLRSRKKEVQSEAKDGFLALNLGLSKYLFTSSLSYGLGVVFAHERGLYKVDINTPAIGVVRLGERFFNSDYYSESPPAAGVDPLAFRLFRISTLLHEAAHSRGQGKYLGFAHVLCPQEIPFVGGTQACDASRNGGNGVKAAFLEAVVKSCQHMRSKDSEVEPLPLCQSVESLKFLRKRASECRSRILSQEFWDETPVASAVEPVDVMKKFADF